MKASQFRRLFSLRSENLAFSWRPQLNLKSMLQRLLSEARLEACRVIIGAERQMLEMTGIPSMQTKMHL